MDVRTDIATYWAAAAANKGKYDGLHCILLYSTGYRTGKLLARIFTCLLPEALNYNLNFLAPACLSLSDPARPPSHIGGSTLMLGAATEHKVENTLTRYSFLPPVYRCWCVAHPACHWHCVEWGWDMWGCDTTSPDSQLASWAACLLGRHQAASTLRVEQYLCVPA